MALVDIASLLSFTGMKGGEMEAVTVPDLCSPKGHPNAVIRDGKACYPWTGGGSTVATAGIVKRATVRGVFGAEWAKMVEQERLRQAESLDDNGQPIPYTCGSPVNGTRWVHNGDGDRLAFKTNADESRLYATIVVARSLGYAYYTADGAVVDAATVAPFLRDRSNEGKRQGVTDPLIYRDYAADRVARLTIGKAVAWGDAKALATALAAGDTATIRSITDSLMPSVGEGVTG